jgi:hypothetical protein
MKDPTEVLRQKQEDLARVRHQVESLRIAASLLSDELATDDLSKKKESASEETLDLSTGAEATGTEGLFSATIASRRSFWRVLKGDK